MRWTVVVPMRSLPSAKSRLADATDDPQAHRTLVEAIRSDTVLAAGSAAGVARVIAVADAELHLDVPTVIQQRPGLNGALRDAAEHAARTWPEDGVVALVGDLPALRGSELTTALGEAARYRRAFVADADGVGTTLLSVLPGVELRPAFGPDSAQRHGAIAIALDAGPGLRLDVDTEADLATAFELGVGPATHALMEGRVGHRCATRS